MRSHLSKNDQPKKVLTWHIHGSYLYYLTQTPHIFYLPVKDQPVEGYSGRAGSFAWGENVIEVPAEQVGQLELDCVLFQSKKNYLEDQFELLSDEQLRLPKVYLEHDPPRENPTDTKHVVNDPNVILVHVTPFNDLMWDAGQTPTFVIDHGVIVPDDARYQGTLERGIVIVNNLKIRGRRLGEDIYREVQQKIPLDLVGMNSTDVGGLGEIANNRLPYFESKYRFFFNPIRYTSLGLAVCEAMMLGMPIIGLATTEMVTVVENGVSGYIDTNIDRLVEKMQVLLDDAPLAKKLGDGARRTALGRFNIDRFARDWTNVFNLAIEGAGSRQLV